MAKGIATRHSNGSKEYLTVGERTFVACLEFRLDYRDSKVPCGYKTNYRGEILYALPGGNTATERELREFHAERLRG